MPEITQKLGFDTGNAVSAISAMDNALRSLNTRLRAFNKVANESNGSTIIRGFAQVDQAAAKAATAVDKFGSKASSASKKAASGVQTVTFAFSGLAKALVARTAVQAITVMTGAISESADAAAEFELAMARISNIAQGPGSSINELTASLAELAVELGRPQTEVAEAAWEALQNDLGTTAETMDLLKGAANDLALVTGGTLTQSVNSLSSVLKAYDLDVSNANMITDQFFAAIDKGRITLKELESSLGKITPLAAKLDIGFGEVAAAMAAITQSGTSAAVANTQLRSIMQKLIRPTEELQGAFNKLGADTFNELIAKSGGLQPALEGIADALDRDDRAIAQAFGRLRGQLGVFNLLANEGKIFSTTLEAVENSAGKAAKAADAIDGTNARESQRAWAEFDETMRQIGETVLVAKTAFVETFNVVISSGAQAIGIIKGITVAAGSAAIAAKVMGLGLVAALGPIAAIAAVGAIWGKVIAQLFELADSYKSVSEKARLAAAEISKFDDILGQMNAREAVAAAEEAAQAQIDATDKYLGKASAGYQKLASEIEASQKDIVSSVKSATSGFASDITRIIGGIAKGLDKMKDKAQSFRDKAAEMGATIEELDTQKALSGLSKQQQAVQRTIILEKALLALRKASAAATGDAASTKALEAADKRVQEAGQRAKAALEATASKNREKEAIGLERRVAQAHQTAYNKVADNLNKAALDAEKGKSKEAEANLNKLKDIAKEIELGGLDNDKLSELKKQFKDVLGDVDTTALGPKLTKELQAAVKKFGSAMNSLQIKYLNVGESLQKALDAHVFTAKVDLSVQQTGNVGLDANLEAAKGIEDPGKSLKAQQNVVKAFLADQAQLIAQRDTLNGKIQNTINAMQTGLNTAKGEKDLLSDIFGANIAQVTADVVALGEKIKDANAGNKESLNQSIIDIGTSIDKLQSVGLVNSAQASALIETLKGAQTLLDQSIERNAKEELIDEDAAKKGEDAMAAITRQAALADQSLIRIKASSQGVAKGMEDSEAGAEGAADGANDLQSGTAGARAQAVQLAGAWASVRAQVAAANSEIAKGATANAYHGGKVAYRASGGPTRGLDTNLTATAPGEYITSAKNTRKFYSELQAMNAGQTPQYRDKGGPVTNIGDINVSVSGESASTSPQVGRSIASELRRELRRQTSTL